MKTFIGLLFLMMSGEAVFSLPVVVEKNIVIRAVEGRKAIQKGSYVLKAGSIIDIPDQYIVRNSVGDIDFTATLLNWRTSDSNNGVYSLVGANNEIIGQDVFFQLKVLQAAPGSKLPKDFTGYIALEFLARTRSLKTATVNNAPLLTEQEKALAGGKIPIPTPRPDRNENEQMRQTADSKMLPTGSSGGSVASGGGIPASGSSKQDVLQPDTTSTKDDLLVFEKSAPKVDTTPVKEIVPSTSKSAPSSQRVYSTPPLPKMSDAVSAMQQATATLPGAGTAAAVCPDGQCDLTLAASEDEERLACGQIAKGDFPESLNSVRLTAAGQKIMDASLKWFSQNLKNPRQCFGSCQYEGSTGIAVLFNDKQKELEKVCNQIGKCSERCKTSDIQTTWSCTKNSRKRAKECAKTCSPYLGLDQSHRGDHLKRLFSQITSDVERNNPSYARKMKKSGIKDNMDQRLLCLNKRRENVNLDPMTRNCRSTAIGIGQVLIGTFYYGFGLANEAQQKRCINYKLKDLATKCKGWDKNAFRKEIYWKYMDYTPKELHEMRTLDVELQARASYATFLDKLRLKNFNLNRAYRGYFGKSDKNAINRIERCVKTGR